MTMTNIFFNYLLQNYLHILILQRRFSVVVFCGKNTAHDFHWLQANFKLQLSCNFVKVLKELKFYYLDTYIHRFMIIPNGNGFLRPIVVSKCESLKSCNM